MDGARSSVRGRTVPKHHGPIECEARLRKVPPRNSSMAWLRIRELGATRDYDRAPRCSRSGNRRIVFGLRRLVVFCGRAILAASCAACSVWPEDRRVRSEEGRLGPVYGGHTLIRLPCHHRDTRRSPPVHCHSSSAISGACRHIVRAQRCTSAASAKLIGHFRTSQTLLLSRETEEVVAIKPFSAFSKCTSDQNAFTVSMPTILL